MYVNKIYTDKYIYKSMIPVKELFSRIINGWMDREVDSWIDGWMEEWMG